MDDPILEAGRAIRPYLRELLDPEEAVQLDVRLGEHLAEMNVGAVRGSLELHRATLDWTAQFLENGLPPELVDYAERGFSPAPGRGDEVSVPKYVCPHGDYAFFRHAVGQAVPKCTTHHCDLVRA